MADRGVDLGTIGLHLACRPALHHQVPVGAGGRRARHALADGAARAAARLADCLAAAADRHHPVPRHARPGLRPACGGLGRAAGRLRLGDAGHRHRRLPRREPAARGAGGRHGELRRGLSRRHAGVGRGRGRAHRLAGAQRRRQGGGVGDRLCGGGGAGGRGAARRAGGAGAGDGAAPDDGRAERVGRAGARRPRRRGAPSPISSRAMRRSRSSPSSSSTRCATRWPAP